MEWLDVVLGALIAWSAHSAGKRHRRRTDQYNRKQLPPEPKPICGCTHHYSAHDEEGRCHEAITYLVERGQPRNLKEGMYGDDIVVYDHEKWETTACACKRYTGPEPLPRYVT